MPAPTMVPGHSTAGAPPSLPSIPPLKHTSSHLGALPHPSRTRNLAHAFSQDGRSAVVTQASADQICILDPENDRLTQCLSFWSAFESQHGADRGGGSEGEQDGGLIQCLAAGQGPEDVGLMIAAAARDRVALWSTSTPGSSSRVWRLHSSFIGTQGHVTSLDIKGHRLLVGAERGISLWTLAEGGVALWKRSWSKDSPKPIRSAAFCPAGTFFSALLEHDKLPLVWSIPSRARNPILPEMTCKLKHPRRVDWMEWRHSLEGPSQGAVLLTRTVENVMRIWAPVIDEPTKLRLWSSTDSPAFGSVSSSDATSDVDAAGSNTFYLGASDLARAFETSIGALRRDVQMAELGVGQEEGREAKEVERELDQKRTRARRLEHFLTDTPDMLLRVLGDGSIVIKAVANVDRRPPTLLQSYTALRIPPTLSLPPGSIRHVSLSALKSSPSTHCDAPSAILRIQTDGGACESVDVAPALLFDGHGDGLRHRDGHTGPSIPAHTASIVHLKSCSQTNSDDDADGRLLSLDQTGRCILWSAQPGRHVRPLAGFETGSSDALVDSCQGFAADWDGQRVRIHDLETASIVSLPTSWVNKGSKLKPRLLTLRRLDQDSSLSLLVLCLAESSEEGVVEVQLANLPLDGRRLASDAAQNSWRRVPLPLKDGSRLLGVVASPSAQLQLMTISDTGFLESWSLHLRHQGSAVWIRRSKNEAPSHDVVHLETSASGMVAYVSKDSDGRQTLTISDTRSSNLSSGLEHRQTLSEGVVRGLAWLDAPRVSPCLAVAYEHGVELLCPPRLSIFRDARNKGPARWSVVANLDLSNLTNSKLRGVALVKDGAVLIATASQIHRFGPPTSTGQVQRHLLELLAERNGPLPDHHPQVLGQCLAWGRLELVQKVLAELHKAIRETRDAEVVRPEAVELRDYLSLDRWEEAKGTTTQAQATDLFTDLTVETDSKDFSLHRAAQLAEDLKGRKVEGISSVGLVHLDVLLRTVDQVQEHRPFLDENGLRYLLALRSFQLYSSLKDPSRAALLRVGLEVPVALEYRDILWAYHSETQEPLLSALNASHAGKMTWDLARSNGVFLWLRSQQSLRAQAEMVARAQYLADDARDPVKCSLLYYALGKPQLVLGLWRQAAWHPEQKKMLAFLKNDFTLPRWRAAAQKNAFALLSQRRFEFAAVFFLLGESLQDAVDVCVRNLGDVQLGVALARIKEGREDGPVLRGLIKKRILGLALQEGDRWLGSWAFEMLGRRDLAVRVILTPLSNLKSDPDVSSMLPNPKDCVCDDGPHEDASLLLLYQHLVKPKPKSLKTLRGGTAAAMTMPGRTEFDFVLHTNRLLARMGCDLLGLSILQVWQFTPTSSVPALGETSMSPVPVPFESGPSTDILSSRIGGEASSLLVADGVGASTAGYQDRTFSSAPSKSSIISNDDLRLVGAVENGGTMDMDRGTSTTNDGAAPDLLSALSRASPRKGASTLFDRAGASAEEEEVGTASDSSFGGKLPSTSVAGLGNGDGGPVIGASEGRDNEAANTKTYEAPKGGVDEVLQGQERGQQGPKREIAGDEEKSTKPAPATAPKEKEKEKKATASLLRSDNAAVMQKQGGMEFDMGAFGF